ncbi:MAG: hypothetical protein ACFCVK_00350 [Acidimicrobiales bacterium]
MNDGTMDQVRVSFPASPVFSRIGRVAVAGLALRLGIDIADVERLRLAVDRSVAALHGKGMIHLRAQWEPHQLTITIDNPDHPLDEATGRLVSEELATMVDHVHVGTTAIDLTLADQAGAA